MSERTINYDLRRGPYECMNIYPRLDQGQRTQLHATLLALKHCHGLAACWTAAHPR